MSHDRSPENLHGHVEAQHNTASVEAFNSERNQLSSAQVGDHAGDSRLSRMNDPKLNDARETVNSTVAEMITQGGQVTPSQFKVMRGAVDLGLQINAFGPEQLRQFAQNFNERASQQNDPRAANGLRAIAEHLTRTSSYA
ncbi:MAG: hypothetical protein KGS72_28000 [Cyanobacteria bacterium REEB67]|nr:hypothetical protein [Cyanobacteria bacterium REEB67]